MDLRVQSVSSLPSLSRRLVCILEPVSSKESRETLREKGHLERAVFRLEVGLEGNKETLVAIQKAAAAMCILQEPNEKAALRCSGLEEAMTGYMTPSRSSQVVIQRRRKTATSPLHERVTMTPQSLPSTGAYPSSTGGDLLPSTDSSEDSIEPAVNSDTVEYSYHNLPPLPPNFEVEEGEEAFAPLLPVKNHERRKTMSLMIEKVEMETVTEADYAGYKSDASPAGALELTAPPAAAGVA